VWKKRQHCSSKSISEAPGTWRRRGEEGEREFPAKQTHWENPAVATVTLKLRGRDLTFRAFMSSV
jgi:hypothetical protein